MVIDANVLVSFFVDRNESQREAAFELLQKAEQGDVAAIIPQFVVFETTYVLQSQYGIGGERLASVIHAVISFPGVQIADDCPWHYVMEAWPRPLPSFADAALVAVARSNRYDAIATFDRKLAKRLDAFGVGAYW